MGRNYLKKYYLDDNKLAQRARLEFYRALSTGRLIAFTGSMTTQAFGYGSWPQLRMTFSALAADVVQKLEGLSYSEKQKSLELIAKFEESNAEKHWPIQVGMSLIEEVLDQHKANLPKDWPPEHKSKDIWPLDHYETSREAMRVALAQRFRQPIEEWKIVRKGFDGGIDSGVQNNETLNREFNIPLALWEKLGIRRFVTPSYDFELERVAMLNRDNSKSPFEELHALRKDVNENFSWDLGSGRIRRVTADGWALESDLLNRERIDRMIEFAVGTDDVDGHIMHLHGRACDWRSMIVSQRDYDNLYRRNDLNRAPFEFAKRMMMGGNPILFVGLGMGEEELNREMQEFISNNPYRRAAPIFLLWSARPGKLEEPEISAKRLEYLRRLGVLTIFDSDFGSIANQDSGYVTEYERSKEVGKQFVTCIKNSIEHPEYVSISGSLNEIKFDEIDKSTKSDLSDLYKCVDRVASGLNGTPCQNPTMREKHIGSHWRSMAGEIALANEKGNQPVILWDVFGEPLEFKGIEKLIQASLDHEILCVIGPQGCGKGLAARSLAKADFTKLNLGSASDCMLINGGFSFDTDTLLDGIARFLINALDTPDKSGLDSPPAYIRSILFEKLDLGGLKKDESTKSALIVINSMERFFDIAGKSLSAELDEVLSLACKKLPPDTLNQNKDTFPRRVRWVLFGTERVRNYMTEIGATIIDFTDFAAYPESDLVEISNSKLPSHYINCVWEKVRKHFAHVPENIKNAVIIYESNRSGRISGDSINLRRTFFNTILDENILERILNEDSIKKYSTRTARDVLKAMAFVGIPVESYIIKKMPLFKGITDEKSCEIDEVINILIEAKLILKIRGYCSPSFYDNKEVNSDHVRYALHRTLLTELRYRFGIPLNEAKLSTAFNMSLYVAQPIDGDIPDTDIHDELGECIDHLIGSYKLEKFKPDCLIINAKHFGLDVTLYRSILDKCAKSCGSIFQKGDVDSAAYQAERLAIQSLCSTQHIRSLRTAMALVRSYYSTTGLLTLDSGDRLIREGRDGVLLEHAERLDDLIDGYGKMSMARECLRDELGKAILEAIPTLSSNEANRKFGLVFGDVEPFYTDELVWLHNERGVVRLAMGDLYEAQRSFDQAMLINRRWVERGDQTHNWRRIRLNQLTVDIEMGEIGTAERKCDEIVLASPRGLREDKLAIAIATGQKAWCFHLRGQIEDALKLYERAGKALSELGEVRAMAYFGRLRAGALRGSSNVSARIAELDRAMELAHSAVQMDIVHRLEITHAETILADDEDATQQDKQKAYRRLEEALSYALHTDVHRVRCEAAMATAKARLSIADFEGALRYATDAMMVATRYGMELRKIALRALIAKVMAARGHPVTAEHMARTCIKMATRQRYQTAIDQATQVILDIPRISAAISTSDQSGRRNF